MNVKIFVAVSLILCLFLWYDHMDIAVHHTFLRTATVLTARNIGFARKSIPHSLCLTSKNSDNSVSPIGLHISYSAASVT
jgi:hypothetical protein